MKYERRLRRLAEVRGLCPVHMTKLVCVTCEARRMEPVWLGTDAELQELLDLDQRVAPYRDQLPSAGVCPLFRCGGELYGEPYYNAAASRLRLPDDLHTAEELARYAELKRYLQHKDTPEQSAQDAALLDQWRAVHGDGGDGAGARARIAERLDRMAARQRAYPPQTAS